MVISKNFVITLLLICLFLLSCDGQNYIVWPSYAYRDDNPAWSNNGEKIAFFSTGTEQESDRTKGLYVIDADGNNKILIEEHALAYSLSGNPVWLQGDSELVYSPEGGYGGTLYNLSFLIIYFSLDLLVAILIASSISFSLATNSGFFCNSLT